MADAYQIAKKPILIATVGLPRSGKSTILTKLAEFHGAPIVCRDTIRLALHGNRYISAAEDFVKAISKVMIKALFLRGHQTVLCDETNYSRFAREQLKDPMWEVQWLPVLTGAEVCKERALATNQPDLLSVIDMMSARYEPLDPSTEIVLDLGLLSSVVRD